MPRSIERVAVLGAGTMGAAIAAHVANAGLPVLLLDIVPKEPSEAEAERGLTLQDRAVRDRIAREGFERIAKLKPASLMSVEARRLVEIGNLDDDLERLAEVDWIVEAVVERLDVKRALWERVDAVRRPGTLATTNTSGLPIEKIAAGRSEDFRRHFFGTHFFNPPRYMKLLEVIPGGEADPAAVDALAAFAAHHLGKGVVRCKDTPNFIGNRVLSIHGTFVMDWAIRNGYRFEEVDAITGPFLARPKTATFRLQDLVGIDIAWGVAQNLHDLIPEDPHRDILQAEAVTRVVGGLLERDRKGNKTGSGFYRRSKGKGGKPLFEVLDPKTFDYEPQQDVEFPCLAELGRVRDPGERLAALFDARFDDDRGAKLGRAVITHFLGYAAEVAPRTAYDLGSVDNAIRWGFSYALGPFELWDALGVDAAAEHMAAHGIEVAPWVREMRDAGGESFYRRDAHGRVTGIWDWTAKSYRQPVRDPEHLAVADLAADPKTQVDGNKSASLRDLGEGVLLIEFHGKMNAIDDGVVEMLEKADKLLRSGAWRGAVIGNDGTNFSVGANLKAVLEAAEAERYEFIFELSGGLQQALAKLRSGPAPVVAAVHGMALGGGCEVALGVDRIVAHAEAYIGLVEVGVGLLPAGGGLKELVRRVITPSMQLKDADPLPATQKVLENVAMAKVSSSAAEARELGFLVEGDRVVMSRDHLLHEARREVLAMADAGYVAPPPERLYAGGRDLYAALEIAVWSLEQAGFASPHDALIARKIAYILCGGDGDHAEWIGPRRFLTLESREFVELLKTEKTRERVVHMLKTGKPLRN